MRKQIAYLGLDVHKNSITMALIIGNSKQAEFTGTNNQYNSKS